jgi:hypothetical protein
MPNPSKAAALKKKALRYLTPIAGADGAVKAWRFNPGPGLRASGARSRVLLHPDGRPLSEAEARAFRDAAITAATDSAEAAAAHDAAAARPSSGRSLDALWRAYLADQAALAAAGEDEAVKPKTLATYASMIKPWLAWGGGEPIAALTKELILAEYRTQKRARSHHAAMASLRALQAVLAHACRIGWRADNPTLKLGLVAPEGRLRLGQPTEIAALVEAADRIGQRPIGDAIVAAVWTAQRLGDLLACDLGQQLSSDGDYLSFDQSKTSARVQVRVLPALAMRLRGRRAGLLIDRPGVGAYSPRYFNDGYNAARAAAATAAPSVIDLQFRDLRDTAVTRLHLAGCDIGEICLWSGHSLKSAQTVLQEHYLVASRMGADASSAKLEAWAKRHKVEY